MVGLILRPSSLPEMVDRPWSLQLRYHENVGETEYITLVNVTDRLALEIIKAGKPYWLFGEPDWIKRDREIKLEKIRKLREEADNLENSLKTN